MNIIVVIFIHNYYHDFVNEKFITTFNRRCFRRGSGDSALILWAGEKLIL